MISAYKIHFLVWTSLSWSTEFQWENFEIYYNINLGENSWILVYMKYLHVKRLCQSLTRFLISSVDKKVDSKCVSIVDISTIKLSNVR